MTHISVSKLTIIDLDNGLSPGQCQAIICTNAGILLVGPLGTKIQQNLNQNSYIFIQENAFENVVWKMVAISSRPQCLNGKWCSVYFTFYLYLQQHRPGPILLAISSHNSNAKEDNFSVILFLVIKLLQILHMTWQHSCHVMCKIL